ncbi:MAG: c-type cytochrome [Methylophilaceae bacterium]|nr:c-type cytochrome [Methylophilaceae bacterium]
MQERPPTTVGQFVLALLGTLAMPALVIFMLVKMVIGIQNSRPVDTDPAAANAAVEARIKPVGEVAMKGSGSDAQVAKSGEQVVKEICIACHGTGALGAPKIGDNGAWGPRIAQGFDALVKNAINGIRAMPARGGNPDLSDLEIASAVAYMANKSGASFKAPEPPPAESSKAEPDVTPAEAASSQK